MLITSPFIEPYPHSLTSQVHPFRHTWSNVPPKQTPFDLLNMQLLKRNLKSTCYAWYYSIQINMDGYPLTWHIYSKMRKNLFNQHIPSLPNILTSFKLAASLQGLFFIQSKNIYIYFQWYLEHKYPLQYFYLRTIHSNWNVHTYKTTLLYMYTQRLLPPFEVAVAVCVCV